MPDGEGLITEHRYTILDSDVPMGELESDLSEHQYTVGASNGRAIARVGITPYARQKGDEQYSAIRVSRVRAEGATSIGNALETYVTPPLLTEAERQHAALRMSHHAIGLAMLDPREF